MTGSVKTVVFCVVSTALLFALFAVLAVHDDVQWSTAVGAGIVGACIGSFVNVVAFRLPRMLQAAWQQERLLDDEVMAADSCATPCASVQENQPRKTFSLMWPPSACPQCGATIRCWHNVPVIGFLLLRGRCADCAAPISARYLWVEAILAGACAAMGWAFGPGIELLAYGTAFTILLMLVLIDWDTQLLPDCLTQPLLWLGLLFNAQGLRVSLEDAVNGVVLAYGTFWLISRGYRYLSGHDGMGDGDLKLVAALCAWLGLQALPWIMCGAVLSSLTVTGCLVAAGRTQWSSPQPFGPHLALAGCVAAWAL